MGKEQNKYIDLNQFPKDKNGNISWKDSVGIIADFFYKNKKHTVEIIEYYTDKNSRLKIKVDNTILDDVHSSKIKNIQFDELCYEPDYLYDAGDIVNNILILERCPIGSVVNGTTVHSKMYKCRCTIHNYDFINYESHWTGCPICSNRLVVKCVNDIGTTNPELIKFFVNEDDVYTHSNGSRSKVQVVCPICGSKKEMKVFELTRLGYVTCDKCSDGVSYPNKFAHELFRQLSSQYITYIYEYSPDWAGKYSYDNYIKLLNGKEIVVEMDGRFHYVGEKSESIKVNDKEKDFLANENNVSIIRINCDYKHMNNRFSYIKTNIMSSLSEYFDLSNIDWDLCNTCGLSNKMLEVIDYYKNNPRAGYREIEKRFNICSDTLYGYLNTGKKLGMCEYIKDDPMRTNRSKPVKVYDSDDNLIGIYKSVKEVTSLFSSDGIKLTTLKRHVLDGKQYKGYVFKYATYDEYFSFNCNDDKTKLK